MRVVFISLLAVGVLNVYMSIVLYYSLTKFVHAAHLSEQEVYSRINDLNQFVDTAHSAQKSFVSETQQISHETSLAPSLTTSLFSLCRKTHFFECPLIDPDLNKIPINTRDMFKKLHPDYININSTQFAHVWKQFQQLDIPYHVVQSNVNGMFPNIDKIALFGMVQTLQPL